MKMSKEYLIAWMKLNTVSVIFFILLYGTPAYGCYLLRNIVSSQLLIWAGLIMLAIITVIIFTNKKVLSFYEKNRSLLKKIKDKYE